MAESRGQKDTEEDEGLTDKLGGKKKLAPDLTLNIKWIRDLKTLKN